ncbi:MAG TPA: metallophosphoesterase family protein [Candidatus Sulfotelmatobacter sp.]|nr:metallophosphoesterase family protein [Candidatus Sulfotelmatobacter sp.]
MRKFLQGSLPPSIEPATYVIGDIHGCLDPLQRLIDKVKPKPGDELIFVGDYIDRGPQSRQVVDYLLGLPHRRIFLMGNHEKMLLDFLDGEDQELFLANGGQATLRSYGGDPDDIPDAHRAFFKSLRPMYETTDYLFVHAGIRPMVPLAEQNIRDLVWIRHEFFQFIGRFPKPVVFGHTPLRQVLMAEDRIGIDTGCVYGGKLTCLKLPDRRLIQVTGWRP